MEIRIEHLSQSFCVNHNCEYKKIVVIGNKTHYKFIHKQSGLVYLMTRKDLMKDYKESLNRNFTKIFPMNINDE